MIQSISIGQFLGVRNTLPHDHMPLGQDGSVFLRDAANVYVNDAGRIEGRPGYGENLGFGSVTSAWHTADEQRLFVVDDGDLKEIDEIEPLATRMLHASIPEGELFWCEAGNLVFYSGAAVGVISGTQRMPLGIPSPPAPQLFQITGTLPAGRYLAAVVYRDEHGRQGGCTTTSEIELTSPGGIQFQVIAEPRYTSLLFVSRANDDQLYLLAETEGDGYSWTAGSPSSYAIDQAQISAYPAPEGIQQIAYRDARLWVAQPAGDTTFIYRSKPFWYHLFDLFDYIPVPGRVLMMLNIDQALIVGTDTAIYAYSDEAGLTQLAEYGVVPGQAGMVIEGRAVMWTTRGFCVALPFQNLTDEIYSVPPGVRAAIGINESRGCKTVIAATDLSGTANNPY